MVIPNKKFTPDKMQNILYEVHIMTTMDNPICHNKFIITGKEAQFRKWSMETTCERIEELTERAFTIFNGSNVGKSRGSIHVNPLSWTRIYLNALKIHSIPTEKGITESYISLPNGCCTQEKCSIRKYYEILTELICSINI